MQRLYIHYMMGWLWLLVGILLSSESYAQTTPRKQLGILELQGQNRLVYFNTQTNLSNLLTSGTAEEATIECWIDIKGGTNGWEIGDLLPDDKSFSLAIFNHKLDQQQPGDHKLELRIGNNIYRQALSLHSKWNHFAIVFKENKIKVLVNGREQGEWDAGGITSHTLLQRNLYFQKHQGTNTLKITEVRAWNQARSVGVINEQRWAAYPLKSDAELLNLHNNTGLQLLLGGNTSSEETNPQITELTHLHWPNVLKEKHSNLAVTTHGKGIRKYRNISIGSVDTESEHPILDNTHLFLYASNGEYEDKVELEWILLQGEEGLKYHVFKDNQKIEDISADESDNGFT